MKIYSTTNKYINVFAQMCGRLKESVQEREVIDERALRDFSLMLIWIVAESVEERPEMYCELSDCVFDYRCYELDKETNPERRDSYLRLYQMISVIKDFDQEKIREYRIASAARKYRSDVKLICVIQKNPGITYQKLRTTLNIPPEKLQAKTGQLERDGIIFRYRVRPEEGQYFLLTSDGEALCRYLIMNDKRSLSDYL